MPFAFNQRQDAERAIELVRSLPSGEQVHEIYQPAVLNTVVRYVELKESLSALSSTDISTEPDLPFAQAYEIDIVIDDPTVNTRKLKYLVDEDGDKIERTVYNPFDTTIASGKICVVAQHVKGALLLVAVLC